MSFSDVDEKVAAPAIEKRRASFTDRHSSLMFPFN